MSPNPNVIPDYSADCELAVENARQDRLKVNLGDWVVEGPSDAALEFRDTLAGPHEYLDEALDFLVAPKGRFPRHRFDVRSVRGRRLGALAIGQPAFSGQLDFFPRPSGAGEDASNPRWALRAKLSLNPTTWIAHLGTRQILRAENDWPASPLRAFAEQAPYHHWERPLVPMPNVNVGTNRHLQLMHSARWPYAVRCYVRSVYEAFDFIIGQSASSSGMILNRLPTIEAKEIETYWEFWSEQPLNEMDRLERQLRPIAAVSRIGWAEPEQEAIEHLPAVDGVQVGTEFNSPCLRVSWGSDRFLRIYAKTTRRLRFEFEHKCGDSRSLLRSRTSTNHEALYGWLDHAAEDAARKINGLLGRMRSNGGATSNVEQKRPHELFAAVLNALASFSDVQPGAPGNNQIALDLIEQLVTNGRIALPPNDPQRPAVRHLKNRNVLERIGNEGLTHVYVAALPYRSALNELRGRCYT